MRAVLDSILFSIVDERIKETIENLARNSERVTHVLRLYVRNKMRSTLSLFLLFASILTTSIYRKCAREESPPSTKGGARKK